ncbi:MAG TPA: alpha/beta fold hydrolase [Proteobacteria bacterium]|nr:alpha/beta fold hydrolase [Pseudomonadota bacterium]
MGWLLIVALALILALFFAGSIIARRTFVGEYFDETHYFNAADGWTLAIHRYKPKRKRFKEPVILCHGLGANRFNFDLEELSLARYLRDRGFDVFIVELRGIGYSAKRSLTAHDRFDWGYDDFAGKDIPAIIDKALEVSGAERALWVGHSMGGMLAYASFSNPEVAKKVAGAVAIASPASFHHMRRLGRMLPKLKWLVELIPAIHVDVIVRFWIPLVGLALPRVLTAVYNPRYMDRGTLRRAAARLLVPISTRLLYQFGQWVYTGEFKSEERDYCGELEKVRLPFLLLAGRNDLLAPPDSVRVAYEKLGSPDKTYFCFGEDDRTCRFGHGDIVLSQKAKEQVYPMVADWLEKRATRTKR